MWFLGCAPNMASCWATDIVVYNSPCDKTVRVVFQMSPDEARITSYRLALISQNSFFPDVSISVPHASGQTFGEATLNISQELPLQKRMITIQPEGEVCDLNNCLISATEVFDIKKPSVADCRLRHRIVNNNATVAPSSGVSKSSLIAFVAGSILLAAIVITFIVVISKHYYGKTKKKKTLYLAYSNDNDFHRDVIEQFVRFLSRVCSCNVIYDERRSDRTAERRERIKAAMRSSDRILVVTSEGTQSRAVARLLPDDVALSGGEGSRSDDPFTQAYEILYEDASTAERPLANKLVFVTFPYTEPHHRVLYLPGLARQRLINLMEEVEQLCAAIHGTVTGQLREAILSGRAPLDVSVERAIRRYTWSTPDRLDRMSDSDAGRLTVNGSRDASGENAAYWQPPEDVHSIASSEITQLVFDINEDKTLIH